MGVLRATVLVLVVALGTAACGGGAQPVSVDDPWGRPSPTSAESAAFYLTLHGGSSDDVLTGASSDRCTMTELHETMMHDDTMSMEPVETGIAIPAKGTVKLEPGGHHVMCMGVTDPLIVGESVDVVLTFASGTAMTVSVEIREE